METVQQPHIVHSFDTDLKELDRDLARMGGLADSQLADALEFLASRDDELAKKVIANDDRMDAIEATVNKTAVKLLALRQPMADDLRMILSATKVALSLERVGDHAEAIARRGKHLQVEKIAPIIRPVCRMGALVREVLRESLDAFLYRDADSARSAWQRDQEIDDLFASLFRELLTYMMEDPGKISGCAQALFMAKNLERIGDHANNMAEITWYVVKGESMQSVKRESLSSRKGEL